LAETGYMGACNHIGFSVLRMLTIAHPEVFAPFPSLSAPEGPTYPASDLISHLHRLSLDDKTRRYVGAIDTLFERNQEELANTSVPEQWPTFRDHIMRTYTD
jgi:hypothetical protein